MNRSMDMHSELRSGSSKSVVELREENRHFPTSTIATDSVVNNIVVNTEDGNVCCYLCKRKFSCQQLYERHVAESELHRRNLETLIEL
ncbi:Zinc finger and BTB domain-containing protein 20 [Orchesella cincta]|uniref:Zinc finger and BTB domain-containing protein 20 n=1 Tax=Orchesella cincta TaxID=48709 RepID=A0A1D2M659_ORCCI|nr:Zinc finger and BTB domain-containing protein 20 [Orchesella cincta]